MQVKITSKIRTRTSKLTRPRPEQPKNRGSIRGSGGNYLPMLATTCSRTLPFPPPPSHRGLRMGVNRDLDNKALT